LIQKVTQTAEKAAARFTAIDLTDCWQRFCRIDPEEIWDKLASQPNLKWNGAIPTHEPVSLTRASATEPLACQGVDGSQIYPNLDLPFYWAYIQSVAVSMTSRELVFQSDFLDISSLLKGEVSRTDLAWIFYPNLGSLSVFVDLWRTIQELAVCGETLRKASERLVLWDHPLRLNGPNELKIPLASHFKTWIEEQRGLNLAGITSSPRSTLLAETIALHETPDSDKMADYRIDVDDSTLMRFGLKSGQRSACFHYSTQAGFPDPQVYFFYLKTSETEVMRVEVPTWIGTNTARLDQIQASILADLLTTGYPLTLIAAHEAISIPLDIGRELNLKGIITYMANGSPYIQPAKVLAKLAGKS
jgi:hypothetical protein